MGLVGYNCFTTKPGQARCLKNCTPSATQSCTQHQNIMEPILQDATFQSSSLYCFSTWRIASTCSTAISGTSKCSARQHSTPCSPTLILQERSTSQLEGWSSGWKIRPDG